MKPEPNSTMKFVNFDLKNNSFVEFYKDDFPQNIKQRTAKNSNPIVDTNPEKNTTLKNTIRNSKKKTKRKEKKELEEFIQSLTNLKKESLKEKIKEFLEKKRDSLSKEELGTLLLRIMNSVKQGNINSRHIPHNPTEISQETEIKRQDSKIDLSSEVTPGINYDYYQTQQEFVVVFYLKKVEKVQVLFENARKVIIVVYKKDDAARDGMILYFSKEICEKEIPTAEISKNALNFKLKFKKLSQENLNLLISQGEQGFFQETDNPIEFSTPLKSIDATEKIVKKESVAKLLPEYVQSLQLLKCTHFNPLENSCGILNPGIDCYIIAVIQCLFSIKSFTNLLAFGNFLTEINLNNPLSTSKGQMAISLANVLTRMLIQKKPFVLSSLKKSIAKFWGLFDPYQEQDAEEILNFFLDVLHEELNNAPRIKYTPRYDLPDEELAQEYYKSHSLLNQSVIADTFQGFYKSKLSCPKCGHESRKFDPFMNLSIEVPAPPKILDVLVIDSVMDLSKRKISLPIRDLILMKEIYKSILSKLSNTDNMDIIGVVIQNLKITHIVDKEKPLSHYSDCLENILYFLVLKAMPYVMAEHVLVDDNTSISQSFGIPFIISVDCMGKYDTKQIRDRIMCILKKRFGLWCLTISIVKPPLNNTDLFDVVCSIEDRDSVISYDLLPNSIIQVKLLWRSQKVKEACYIEQNDFYVITEKERHEDFKHYKLEDCLGHFFQKETIEWRCEKCKESVDAIKKLDLWSSPEILIIHLKRFSYDMKYQRWIKHDTLIDYPVLDLNLSSFRVGPDQCDFYDLLAVSNHLGSMDRGHYTAFAQRGSTWYHFDDDIVTEVKKEDLVDRCGYILFYQRKEQ